MDFHQLYYFTTIAEEGSFSAAARKINISQPPLSQQIKLLENEYGVKLFTRFARGITLTEEGSTLYLYAKDLLRLRNKAEEALKDPLRKKSEPLRLGLISSYECDVLYAGIRQTLAQTPDLSFRVYEDNTFNLLDMLKKGRLDMAVVRTPYPDQGLEFVDFSEDHIIACGADKYRRLLSKRQLTLQDLSELPLLIYTRWERTVQEAFSEAGLTPYFLCTADDARTIMQWAKRDMGVALVPDGALHIFPSLLAKRVSNLHTKSRLRLVRKKNVTHDENADKLWRTFKKGAEG